MKNYDYKVSKIDSFSIILLLLVSDSIIFLYYLTPKIAYFIFFLYSIWLFYKRKKKIKKGSSTLYLILFIGSILLNIFIFNPNTYGNNGLGTILSTLASFFFISSFNFISFKRAYLKIIAIVAFFSIIVFILSELRLLPLYTLSIQGVQHTMFLIFHIGWPTLFHRMASIWHEPGAAQILLNFALFLYIPEISNQTYNKKELKRLIIVAIGVICTMSTAGYLILMVITFICYYRKVINGKLITRLFFSILITLTTVAILASSIIGDKFSQDIEGRTSLGIRQRDNIALLWMAIDRPFTGYGFDTKDFEMMSSKLDNTTSSNGILYTAACLGIWWIPVYILFLAKAIKKMNFDFPIILLLLPIIMAECNERFIEIPISYIFIFTFATYAENRNKRKKNKILHNNCNL